MSRSLLVTGGTGYLGSELLRRAGAAGWRPAATYHRREPELGGVHWQRADVRDERAVRTLVERRRQRLSPVHERLLRAPALLVERRRARLEQAAARLRALAPAATLARGYAVVRAGERLVRSASTLSPGQAVDVALAEGSFSARVERVGE